jgi:zinc/manganese transport system permease protein/zinc transport system permease protein
MDFLDLPQMQRAFLIALIAGPMAGLLGTFVTMRRMAFFSDAISHGAMTGITLGFALGLAKDVNSVAMQVVLLVFCALIALLMARLFEKTSLHTDTVIAFSYTGSVALGVVVLSRLHSGARVLENALFGDILAASPTDVGLVLALAILTIVFLCLNLRALTLSVVHENLAKMEGFNVRRLNYFFVILIAVVVALLIRQLGALLISGILVVPPAAARVIARNFRQMLVLSTGFGLAGAALGVFCSYHLDTPTGPTIVLTDVAILSVCMLLGILLREKAYQPQSRLNLK